MPATATKLPTLAAFASWEAVSEREGKVMIEWKDAHGVGASAELAMLCDGGSVPARLLALYMLSGDLTPEAVRATVAVHLPHATVRSYATAVDACSDAAIEAALQSYAVKSRRDLRAVQGLPAATMLEIMFKVVKAAEQGSKHIVGQQVDKEFDSRAYAMGGWQPHVLRVLSSCGVQATD